MDGMGVSDMDDGWGNWMGVEVMSEKYAIRFFVSFSWGNYSSKN